MISGFSNIIEITDHGTSFSVLDWVMDFEPYDSPTDYKKKTEIKGYPATEERSHDDYDYWEYRLRLVINDRFELVIKSSDIDIAYNVANNLIDYNGITALRPPTAGEGIPGFKAVFAIVGCLAVVAFLRNRRGKQIYSPSFFLGC